MSTVVINGKTFKPIDTSSSPKTIVLPSNPQNYHVIEFLDINGTFDTNALTIAGNGSTIMGLAEDMVVDTKNIGFELIYIDGDWRLK